MPCSGSATLRYTDRITRLSSGMKLLKHLVEHPSDPAAFLGNECGLVRIDLLSESAQAQISSSWPDVSALEHQLPEDERDNEESDHRIREEEPLQIPAALEEQIVSSRKKHEQRSSHGHIACIGLESRFIWEAVSRDLLFLQRRIEVPVGKRRESIVEQLAAGDEVDEICHDHGGGARDLQESKQAKQHREAERPDRNALFGAPREDPGSVPFEGHAVQRTGCGVQDRVACTEDRCHDHGVD